jgi:hypothetical protein
METTRHPDGERVRDARPWTRWWWFGSCVTEAEITRQLGLLRDAGFGGVEIQPIYAPVDPPVAPFPYLSPAWMRMLEHTLREAGRLGMGVDLTMGSGWPWGGPWIGSVHAARKLVVEREGGKAVARSVPTGQRVKRAGPGGEGPVVDPYSIEAVRSFFAGFEAPLATLGPLRPAAAFTDSFEVFEADHTPHLPTEFLKRRGYHHESWLDRLDGDDELGRRLRHDYRWTMAELLEDSYREWVGWCHAHGMAGRLQAHGAPGPLVDYYALADVPETEAFSRSGLVEPVAKMASSAAHLTARPLCSAEAFTWLGEHFTVGLDAMRRAADAFFLAGVNRLFFQGVPYSPDEVPWPGWLFYASTNSGEHAGWFEHLGCLNAYLARCQAAMSRGEWDPDVLLYFPQHDVYAGDAAEFGRIHGGRLRLCTVSDTDDWFEQGAPGTWRAAQALRGAGVQYDIVTDRIVRERLGVRDGRIECGRDGPRYSVLIFAGSGIAERETLEAAQRLAVEGAAVWFIGGMPLSVPTGVDPRAGFDGTAVGGDARVLLADADLATEFAVAGVRREQLEGFDFIRRREAGSTVYLLRRGTDSGFHGWLRLSAAGGTAKATDPVTGLLETIPARSDNGGTAVHLKIEPGRTLIVEVGGGFGTAPAQASNRTARTIMVPGPWNLSWTDSDGERHHTAAGHLAPWPDLPGVGLVPAAVEYEAAFDVEPAASGEDWLLDLGDLRGSAAINLNGLPIGTAWTAPYRLRVPRGVLMARNTLRMRVLVVEANRIVDLERRGIPWRKFFFVNRDYGEFDASSWTPLPVGLLGPVTLTSR